MEHENKFLVNGSIKTEFISEYLDQHQNEKQEGAQSLFLGQVRRDEVDGKFVKSIEYSAYEKMVLQEFEKIESEISEKYSDLKSIHIKHSIGNVLAGEITLFVMVSSGHRKESFLALEETVELIKDRIPIWKKEFYEDGTHKWINS